MPRTHALDLLGHPPFGRLTAVEPTDERRGGHVVWRCECACGGEALAIASNLRSGNTQSCGCWQKERSRAPNGGRKKRSASP